MTETKLTYLGESGTHYILKIEDANGFLGITEVRKCRQEWAHKYYWDLACNKCSKTEGTRYTSLGGLSLCHGCAHDLGLLHSHPDIEDTAHCLDGIASKEEIAKHLEDYKNE